MAKTRRQKKPSRIGSGPWKIMVSYRRNCPSSETVSRICRRLVRRYGEEAVFFDQEHIREGDKFPRKILDAVNSASVILVMVGRDWAGKDGGYDRILGSDDWVRMEIHHAFTLQRDKNRELRPHILVVGIDGAVVPRAPQLKEYDFLWSLSDLQAYRLDGDRRLTGIRKLVAEVDKHIPRRRNIWGLLFLALLLVGIGSVSAAWALGMFEPKPTIEQQLAKDAVVNLEGGVYRGVCELVLPDEAEPPTQDSPVEMDLVIRGVRYHITSGYKTYWNLVKAPSGKTRVFMVQEIKDGRLQSYQFGADTPGLTIDGVRIRSSDGRGFYFDPLPEGVKKLTISGQ